MVINNSVTGRSKLSIKEIISISLSKDTPNVPLPSLIDILETPLGVNASYSNFLLTGKLFCSNPILVKSTFETSVKVLCFLT